MNVKLSIFLGFIIDCILFPIQSLITRLNSQRLSVVTRAWAAYGMTLVLGSYIFCSSFGLFGLEVERVLYSVFSSHDLEKSVLNQTVK